MAEKIVKIKWEVDVSKLEQARKSQAQYTNDLKRMRSEQAAILQESTRLFESFQRQAQGTSQATDELGRHVAAVEQSAEATARNVEATDKYANALEQHALAAGRDRSQIELLNEAQKSATSETTKSTSAWGKNAKTLLFWTIGAASVFRLVQKIRRAFLETVETLFENTQEYDRLRESQNRLKVSFVAAVGGADDWAKILSTVADALDTVSDGITKASATVSGFSALIRAAKDDIGTLATTYVGAYAQITGRENLAQAAFGAVAETDTSAATAFLDAYAASLAEAEDLTERFRVANIKSADSLDQQKDKAKELEEAERDLNRLRDEAAEAQKRRLRDLADLELERLRRLQDINTELQRELSDLALKGTREREDIEIAFRRRLEDIQRRQAAQRARIEERLRLKLLRIELRFREQMIRIRENFDDSIYDAIQKRDATAALLAIRRRARDEGRARRERANAILLAQTEAQMRRNELLRAQENERQDAILARQRALEDLALDLARERQDIQINHQRELEDLAIFLERRRADIETDYQRRIEDARAQYTKEEQEYQKHLDVQYTKYQSHISRMRSAASILSNMPAMIPTVMAGGQPGTPVGADRSGDVAFPGQTTAQATGRDSGRVTAQQAAPGATSFSGTMRHQVSGDVSAALAGFEGRLGAMITDAVIGVMGEMLQ